MAKYPDIAVGDLITADLLASMLPDIVRKASDEDAPLSTAAVQDDNELIASVVANASYLVEAWLRYTAASATPDLRLNYSYPAAASFTRTDWGPPSGSTTAADTIDTTVATTGDNGRGADANPRSIYMKGDLVTGANAGSFTVRFGQVTSSVDKVTMKAGSHIKLTRYA